MSWTDPCRQCGEPRYTCQCGLERKIYTQEELDNIKMEQEKNKKICSTLGHDWEYTFIVYQCKRCGETTNY